MGGSYYFSLRFIPKFNNTLSFNIASVWGYNSVLMTYFRVNYYLSRLHTYAGGDLIPFLTWAYVAIFILLVLIISSYIKNKRVSTKENILK